MQTYRLAECKLWYVVATVKGNTFLDPAGPIMWPEACRTVQTHLVDGADDVMLLPAGPARPWSERTLTAYLNVLDGPPTMDRMARLQEQQSLLDALTTRNMQMLRALGVGAGGVA